MKPLLLELSLGRKSSIFETFLPCDKSSLLFLLFCQVLHFLFFNLTKLRFKDFFVYFLGLKPYLWSIFVEIVIKIGQRFLFIFLLFQNSVSESTFLKGFLLQKEGSFILKLVFHFLGLLMYFLRPLLHHFNFDGLSFFFFNSLEKVIVTVVDSLCLILKLLPLASDPMNCYLR